MTKTKERKKPVVGQMVYVAFGSRRGDVNGYFKVTRVGRKYGYFIPRNQREELPFSLATGMYHEPNHNSNMNGWGFQVYESKEEYEQERTESREKTRLKERLTFDMHLSSGIFYRLPHDAVMKIHAILDDVEAGKVEDGDE